MINIHNKNNREGSTLYEPPEEGAQRPIGATSIFIRNKIEKVVVENTMSIDENAYFMWVGFGDKKQIFEILEKYLGVKRAGWDEDMPDEKKNFKNYNHPVKVKITATKGKIAIEKVE